MRIFDCCGSSFLRSNLLFRSKKNKMLHMTSALYLDSQLNYLLIKTFSNFFVMYSSTWNVNAFKVSKPFHVHK
jgi:hypothetical protein